MRSLADYENYIATNFDHEGVGLDLSIFPNKTFEKHIKVDLVVNSLLDFDELSGEIRPIVTFMQNTYLKGACPLWYKVNIMDQAVKDYVSIGRLNLKNNWLRFIINYLDYDRAEEMGDTMIAIFDTDFNWTISFTLSQDCQNLKVQKLEK